LKLALIQKVFVFLLIFKQKKLKFYLKGLCSLSSNKENNVLACPDIYEGIVNVHIYGKTIIIFIIFKFLFL